MHDLIAMREPGIRRVILGVSDQGWKRLRADGAVELCLCNLVEGGLHLRIVTADSAEELADTFDFVSGGDDNWKGLRR